MFFNSSIFAQNVVDSIKIKSDSSEIVEQKKLSDLLEAGILNWSKNIKGSAIRSKSILANSKEECDSLVMAGVLKRSKSYKKQDTVELKRLLDNNVIQWSEKKRNLGVKTKNDN